MSSSNASSEDKKHKSAWLSRHGGWVLLMASTVLIGLAALFSNRPAVAPVFAVGGIAFIILGVFLPRIQGTFEFNATGFKFFLSEIERESRELPPIAKAQVLDSLLESASERGVPRGADATREAHRVVGAALEHRNLQEAVARWLEGQGWGVNQEALTPSGRRADIIAERDGELLVVEVKKGGRMIQNWADVKYQLRGISDGLQRDQPILRLAVFLEELPKSGPSSRHTGDGFEVWVRKGDGFEKIA
jgi:hypothetical protein